MRVKYIIASQSIVTKDAIEMVIKSLYPPILLTSIISLSLAGCGGGGSNSSSSTNTTPAPTPNSAPVAVITLPTANNGDKYIGLHNYQLSGTDSTDSDGNISNYQWTQISGEPIIVGATNQSSLEVKPLNLNASYEFELTVTDNDGESHSVQTIIESSPYYLDIVADRWSQCAIISTPNGNGVECYHPFAGGGSLTTVPELTDVTNLKAGIYGFCSQSTQGSSCWGYDPFYLFNDFPELTNIDNLAITLEGACQLENNQVNCWTGGIYANHNEVELNFDHIENPIAIANNKRSICVLGDNQVNCQTDIIMYLEQPQFTNPVAIYGGPGNYMCASDDNGLSCWWSISPNSIAEPHTFPHLTDIIDLQTTDQYFCALYNVAEEAEPQFDCFDYSTAEPITHTVSDYKVQSFATNRDGACAITKHGISCWSDYYYNDLQPPQFDQITLINSGDISACVIGIREGEEQLECWGHIIYDQMQYRSLNNPTYLHSEFNAHCLVDDNGPFCWGSHSYSDLVSHIIELPESWSNASIVNTNWWSACAIVNGQVECRGWEYATGLFTIPELSNPTELISTSNFHCAKDDTGLVCWGELVNGQLNVPTVNDPIHMDATGDNVCLIDDNLIKCFGINSSLQNVPVTISNPTKVSVTTHHACALEDNGVTCWGSNESGQLEVPQLSNPTEVITMDKTSCVVDKNGDNSEIVCWGWKGFGGTFITP